MDLEISVLVGYTALVIAVYVLTLRIKSYPTLTLSRDSLKQPTSVSIIVPARNEEDLIERCVKSLKALDYSEKEVIVVDGGSTDRTPQILAGVTDVKVIEEPPLPKGWVGKNWACHTGYENSMGELLLFTDGDTVHAPDSLQSSVQYLSQNNLDMFTLIPRVVTEGFWENTLLPLVFQAIFFLTGGDRANDPKSHRFMANGQYILIRRSAYEKVGGHEALRSRIDEDYRMAQAVKGSGLKLRVVFAPDFMETRMYKNFREMWEGWSKNFFAGANYRIGWFLVGIGLVFTFLLAPFLLLFYGVFVWLVSGSYTLLAAGLLIVGILTARTAFMNLRWRYRARYALAMVLSVTMFLAIMVNSMIGYTTGRGVAWKGRRYQYSKGKLS
jgi:chlorobactene glucosyltransferase